MFDPSFTSFTSSIMDFFNLPEITANGDALQLNKESFTELTNHELTEIHGGTTPWCLATLLTLIAFAAN